MSMGRPAKPLALHVLNGNPSRLDLKEKLKKEIKPKKTTPRKPNWLSDEAKAEWD